jgi:hypothetical protein
MTLRAQVRQYMMDAYIYPAREPNMPAILVASLAVSRALGLEISSTAVCDALDSARFQEKNELRVLERRGPTHGRDVTWVLD